jgi:GNAT superfamily N-acetyltransferase
VDDGREPVGFVLLELVDQGLHLSELSVAPDHGRRGLGRRLVEFVCEWGRVQGFDALTLTTYRDVAWNGPFYQRLGFRVIPEASLGEGLRALRRAEAAQGLDPEIRDVMRRELFGP